MVAEMLACCTNSDGTAIQNKSTQFMNVAVLQLQLYTAERNNAKVKEWFEKANAINHTLVNPRTIGLMYECSGKMYMREGNYKMAWNHFFETFKGYEDNKIESLQYLLLTSALSEPNVDIFDGVETTPYKYHTNIIALQHLLNAYKKRDIVAFQRIQKVEQFCKDFFLEECIFALYKSLLSEFTLFNSFCKIQVYTDCFVKIGT